MNKATLVRGKKRKAGKGTMPGPAEEFQSHPMESGTSENFQVYNNPNQFEKQPSSKNNREAAVAQETAAPKAQTAIPGTEQKKKEDKPKEPRTAREIEHDFRMVVFEGMIASEATKYNEGTRELKLDLRIGDHFVNKVKRDLMKFSANEEMTFRVLSKQPRLDDKEPEEFGSKVPAFGVAMIERLEKEAFQGFVGWENLSIGGIMSLITERLAELPAAKRGHSTGSVAVDIANLAFFLWWNTQVAETKKTGRP